MAAPSTSSKKAAKDTAGTGAAGSGKSKKKFAEDAGIAHLLSLSNSITDAKSQLLEQRIHDKKQKVQAHQLKKQQDAQRKKEKATAVKPEARAKTKAEIKASLKAQKRDKAKLRKEKRKERAQLEQGDAASAPAKAKAEKKPRKSVSFALA